MRVERTWSLPEHSLYDVAIFEGVESETERLPEISYGSDYPTAS